MPDGSRTMPDRPSRTAAGRRPRGARRGGRARRSSGRTIVAWRSAALPGGRGRRAGALPGVRADVVVVAAGAEEGRLVAELRHQAEPEHVAVEGDRLRDRGDLEVDVAHHRAGRRARRTAPSPGRRARGSRSSTSSGSVVIRWATLPSQPLARPVGVDLDPVAVGVAEVDRLADEVVGEPLERDAVARGMREPAREVAALRHEEREVVEPGVARARAGRPAPRRARGARGRRRRATRARRRRSSISRPSACRYQAVELARSATVSSTAPTVVAGAISGAGAGRRSSSSGSGGAPTLIAPESSAAPPRHPSRAAAPGAATVRYQVLEQRCNETETGPSRTARNPCTLRPGRWDMSGDRCRNGSATGDPQRWLRATRRRRTAAGMRLVRPVGGIAEPPPGRAVAAAQPGRGRWLRGELLAAPGLWLHQVAQARADLVEAVLDAAERCSAARARPGDGRPAHQAPPRPVPRPPNRFRRERARAGHPRKASPAPPRSAARARR